MKPEDLDLLFRAISCYIPYGLVIKQEDLDDSPLDLDGVQTGPMLINSSDYEDGYRNHDFGFHCIQDDMNDWHSAYETPPKPYLVEFQKLPISIRNEYNMHRSVADRVSWCLAHHVDVFGLIPRNLAIPITTANNPY